MGILMSLSHQTVAIQIFHAVGLPFLEKLLSSPVEDFYDSSYCAVGLAFLRKFGSGCPLMNSFCDYKSLQTEIIQLIVPMLQQLKASKSDVQRRDVLSILFSLSANAQLLPVPSVLLCYV